MNRREWFIRLFCIPIIRVFQPTGLAYRVVPSVANYGKTLWYSIYSTSGELCGGASSWKLVMNLLNEPGFKRYLSR